MSSNMYEQKALYAWVPRDRLPSHVVYGGRRFTEHHVCRLWVIDGWWYRGSR